MSSSGLYVNYPSSSISYSSTGSYPAGCVAVIYNGTGSSQRLGGTWDMIGVKRNPYGSNTVDVPTVSSSISGMMLDAVDAGSYYALGVRIA